MRGSVLVAFIAATPPTLAAMLAFFSTRASARMAAHERAAMVAQSLDNLGNALARVEAGVERVETAVTDLRERVAHLEGARTVRPLSPA
jgi:hypothetical protein